MCLGLSGDVVSCLSRYGGEGIVFICTACHSKTNVDSTTGVSSEAFSQLCQTVKKLCETVQCHIDACQTRSLPTASGESVGTSDINNNSLGVKSLIHDEIKGNQ